MHLLNNFQCKGLAIGQIDWVFATDSPATLNYLLIVLQQVQSQLICSKFGIILNCLLCSSNPPEFLLFNLISLKLDPSLSLRFGVCSLKQSVEHNREFSILSGDGIFRVAHQRHLTGSRSLLRFRSLLLPSLPL